MSQRFSLFYAGFTAQVPALYFSRLEFIDACKSEEGEAVKNFISSYSQMLQQEVYENTTHLKTAISIAKHLEMELLPEPKNSDDYYNWLVHYTDCIEKEFPMARIDHYYFLYSRKIAEICKNIGLVSTYMDFSLSAGQAMDLPRKVEKCLKDTEYILFKLMAAAALLSSEPRQNYFNIYYRSLCQEFLPFKEMDITKMSEPEFKKLGSSIKEYELLVLDGFKKCIGLLKELGI